jgi:dTDP-4-dehydrorhamnose reductase
VRVLITGAGGQLGADITRTFDRSGADLLALTREELDITHEPAVSGAVTEFGPETIVNCAAWTDVDACEEDPERAHLVNAIGPWWLARAASRTGAALVHFSTDYVFGAEGTTVPSARGFTEFDPVAPINAYGRSKAASESLVRQALPQHYIIRTSWLAGVDGGNFVKTMLRLGQTEDQVEVVNDQVGSPTFTNDLAVAVRELVCSGRFGTYNRTNAGTCTWFDLAQEIFRVAGIETDLTPIDTDSWQHGAPRPRYSVLSNTHAIAAGFSVLPGWRTSLEALLADLDRVSATRGGP